ncbi:MAG TPA: hypothetical protein VIX82_07300 [Solirubrobacteraceae bacterium]
MTTAARRGLAPFISPRAPSVLGGDHPLSRIVILVHALARQLAATTGAVVLAVVAVAERWSWGIQLLGAALLVELTLLAIFALARGVRRERVLWLIAKYGVQVPLEEVAREAIRLATPRHSADLAGRLERALDEAAGWHRLPVASRPPPGIRLLGAFAPEVHAIAEQLRSGRAALPGIALLELFLIGGYGSRLYGGDKLELGEQLRRIRQLLSLPGAMEADRGAE